MVARTVKLVLAGAIALAAVYPVGAADEPSVVGLWQKTDEETGKPVGWFLFVEHDGTYEGVIAKLFLRPTDPPNPTCSSCKDDRKDEPMLGLPLIRDMKPTGWQSDGVKYENGNILDPRDGNIYNAMMTVSPDGQTLTVRGFLGFVFLGRNEVWHRLPDSAYKELDPTIIAQYLPGQVPAAKPAASARHVKSHPETTARSSYPGAPAQ